MTHWTTLRDTLEQDGYVASPDLAMAVHLALTLERPLLLEGEAGVGKTEIARALSRTQGCDLIRLQCYEGLDANQAIYEWNYQRQLLAIRAASETDGIEDRLFTREYLLERPLLRAITHETRPVLLIDEIDRADEEFEAFLLEVLADYQITIPELGTITAKTKPIVILTANGTRDLSDALRRRCLYAYVEYPDAKTEERILAHRCPEVEGRLAAQIIGFVQSLRREELEKKPGIAEMLDFAAAIAGLGLNDLTDDPAALHASLATLLKTQTDRANLSPEVAARLIGKAA